MTNFHYETVTCPYCLNEEELPIWDVVDIEEDPDLKEKILQKDLQNYICQNCNRTYILDQAFLYLDPERELGIYYAPRFAETLEDPKSRNTNGELEPVISENLPLDFGIDLSTYKLRIVSNYNQLIEKIHIDDYQLDDRLIEVIKIAVKINPPTVTDENGNNTVEQIAEIYFLGIDENKHIYQTLSTDSDTWRQVVLEPSVYQSTVDLLGDHLPEHEHWNVVDEFGTKIFLKNQEP